MYMYVCVCTYKYTVGTTDLMSTIKFYKIMSSNNVNTIKKLCMFILKIYMYEVCLSSLAQCN